MKRHFASKKIILLAVCLLLGAAVALSRGSLAIYTSQVFQRSVVRNRNDEAIRFSSDKLFREDKPTEGDDPPELRVSYYAVGEGQTRMTFQVCNYDQANATVFNPEDVKYTVTVSISGGTDGFAYTVTGDGVPDGSLKLKNGESKSFTDTLTGGSRAVRSYTVGFNKADYGKVRVEIRVTPHDYAVTKNRRLAAVLIPVEYTAAQGLQVNGEWIDKGRPDAGPGDFDGYNYLVTVSGGAGRVKLRWNAAVVDIDPFFLMGLTSETPPTETEAGVTYTYVEMDMDPADATGSRLIQFYNHNSTKPRWASWDDIPVSVTLIEDQTP